MMSYRSPNPGGWSAHLIEELPMDQHRVILCRRVSDLEVEVITDATEQANGRVHRARVPVETDGLAARGLWLPTGALEAIAEAIKPGPATGELRRLEEALELERGRVDSVLRRLVPRAR